MILYIIVIDPVRDNDAAFHEPKWTGEVCIEIFLSDFLTNTFVAVCTIHVPEYLHYSDPCLKMQAFRSFRGDDNCRVDCR